MTLILTFLLALRAYIGNSLLCSNFILGHRYLQDTIMLIDVLIDIISDPLFRWTDSEPLFNILVDSPGFLFSQLGLKTENVTGHTSQSSLMIYAMTYFDGLIFYRSEASSPLYLYLFCIIFEVHSSVCIKLAYVMRCLSP